MTLTEEQRPTAGFDLEKARDVEKAMSPMPWIVLEEAHGEMIIIRNPNHPMYIDGIVAWGRVAEANTPDAIGIAYMRENFSNLIGEIERLRAENLELQVAVFGPDGIRAHQACIIADQAARISELEIEIAELKADLEQSERVIEARLDVIDQQAARIKEHEDALVEELARGDYFDESQECEGYWWDRKNTSDCTQNDYRRNARLKLQAKGKIGPDADAKPRVWQITEERVEALQDAVNRYDVYDRCLVTHDRKVHVLGVLRAMLTEADQK